MNSLVMKLKGSVIKIVVLVVVVLTLALIFRSSAQAATTPYCVYHNYVLRVVGGCNGTLGAGHDRMWIRCRVKNAPYWTDRAGVWHNRYSDWQEARACYGDEFAWQVWFEHKNN